MNNKKTMAVILSLVLVLHCLSGIAVPERAYAADTLSWEGWEYQVNGGAAAITGYTGDETDITLPNRLPKSSGSEETVVVNKIAYKAFANNQSIVSVVIPEGYYEIEPYAFTQCTSLQSVALPASAVSWPDYDNTYDGASLPAPSNSNGAFWDCTSLNRISIPEGMTVLGKQIFKNCVSLEEVELPSTLEEWEYAFQGASGLKKVILKEGITSIPRNAFNECTSLEELVIPDTVTLMDYNCISGTTKLNDLVIPASLTVMNGSIYYDENKDSLGTLEVHSLTYSIAANENLKKWQTIRLPRYSMCEKCWEGQGYNLEYLPSFDAEGLEVTAYEGEYDGQEHEAVSVAGYLEGDRVSFSTEKYGTFTEEMPVIKEAETRTIWVRIEREGYYSPYQTEVTAIVQDSRPAVIKKIRLELSKANAIAQEKEIYTNESWTALETAISKGEGILEDDTALLAQLEAVLEELQAARGGLMFLSDVPVSPGPEESDTPVSPLPEESESPASPSPGAVDTPATPTTSPDSGTSGTPVSAAPASTDVAGQSSPAPMAIPETSVNTENTKISVAKAVLNKVVSTGKKTAQLSWKKTAGAEGIEIRLGTNRKMTKNKRSVLVKGTKTTKKKITKLKSGKKYYVKIRGWRMESGKKKYGAWSTLKTVKIK